MPRIAGPWLAGTFDTDRAVARAATEALNQVFTSPEKIIGVKKTFQRSLLEYSRDAALHETAQTLSDERTVSSDDAKTTLARVVATALLIVTSLMTDLSSDDRAKEADVYAEVVQEPRLWSLVHDSDASVRRAVNRLVQTCLGKQPDLVESDLKAVSKAYVYQGLQADQTSSALDFLRALQGLTEKYPTIWTESYTGKKPAISRLRQFLKKGAQGAPPTFWDSLDKLLKSLPESVLPTEEPEIAELLSALRSGVCKKEERFNATAAWPVYYTLADLVLSSTPNEVGKRLAEAHVLPIVKQYLDPAPETADWSITGAKASTLVSQASKVKNMNEILNQEWPLQTDRLIELAKMSQPEQAKDFDKSQRHVATTGERFVDLQRDLWNMDNSLDDVFTSSSHNVVTECIEILNSRNGKPYGAAAIIESLLRAFPQRVIDNASIWSAYLTFAKEQLATLAFGPSKRHLIHGLFSLHDSPEFSPLVDTFLEQVLDANESVDAKLGVVETAFTPASTPKAADVALANHHFQDFITQRVAASRFPDSAMLFANLVKAGAVSDKTVELTLSDLATSLSVRDSAPDSLSAIETLWSVDEPTIRGFMSSSAGGAQLLPNVLKLEQSSDDTVADKAVALSSKLAAAPDNAESTHSKFSIIIQNLETTSAASLSINSVNDYLDRLLGGNREVGEPTDLLPSLDTWQSALCAAMRPPKPSLALLSPLGGTVQLIKDISEATATVQYDSEGLSQALRLSMYITKLFAETDIASSLVDRTAELYALLFATTVLADDNLSIPGSNGLWHPHGQDTEEAALEFVSDANKILGEYFKVLRPTLTQEKSNGYAEFTSTLHSLKSEQVTTTATAYYAGLCSAKAHDTLCEMHGSSAEQSKQAEAIIKDRRSAKDVVGLAAAIAGFRQSLAGSQILNRYCNELVADLTDLDVDADTQKGFEQLTLFNVMLSTQEDGISVVAKQRRIFLVKRLLTWLETQPSLATQAEIYKALSVLLEGISDMYGEHWEQTVSLLIRNWSGSADGGGFATNEEAITMTNTSLRLLHTLRRLSKSEESNDDLTDVLKDKQDDLRHALIQLLVSEGSASDEGHQPLQLTHELLARQLAASPFKPMKDTDEMFSLLYAPSRAVMQGAFDLLHTQVPAAQEQISFDAALENESAQLPDELLSLLLEAPTLDSLADASFHRMMPLALQSYLYSWRLLFDHFQGSSYKVKNDYIEQLKDGSYLTNLLDLVFDFLGHTRGRPADASKFDVQEYTPDVEPSPEKDVQWLLAHLYYLALTHLPSLVKSYYLNIRSRQTSQAIDSWTGKYISPLVIRSSLEAVDEWSQKSVNEDPEYEKMAVKVGTRSREINVSYVVDEQTMAIKVVLPEAYPLASAQVVGVSRVAVKEEKWQSWLRNCQGVITFSVSSSLSFLATSIVLTKLRRTAASPTVSPPGDATSPVRLKAKRSVRSATPSSAPTSSCRPSAARLARTCSTRAVCSSGSRLATRALVHCAEIHSTSTEKHTSFGPPRAEVLKPD